MEKHILTAEQITAYHYWLSQEKRALGTIEKYRQDIRTFVA